MTEKPYALSLLGPPSLRNASGEKVAFPQKAFVLIAFLYFASGNCSSRNALANLLYGGVDQSGAMANLRQLLGRVQKRQADLGMRLIVLSRDEVRLLREASNVEIDIENFAEIEATEDVDALTDKYQGDFLEGLEGDDDGLDAWLSNRRAQLRTRFFDLLHSASRNVGGFGSEKALRRALEIDPYREDTWRALLSLVRQRHGPAAVELAYRQMTEQFSSDLGTMPDTRTANLMESFRKTEVGAITNDWNGRPAENLHRGLEPAVEGVGAFVPRLAILMPFQIAPSGKHAQLVGSLIEDITLGLCRLRSVAVIAPHTAWRLAEEGETVRDQFQLDYVVETNLQRLGDRTRLYIKLVRISDRVIIVGDTYDLTEAYIGHHDQLTNLIVQALADGLERAEAERFATVHRPDAYQWLLQGRQHLRVLDLPDLRRARKAFTQALSCDPTFVPALSGTARTLILEWLLLARTDQELLIHAQSISKRAVDMDPFSAEALRGYAGSTLLLGGLDEATHNFTVAERLAPHHADILADHANALSHCSEMTSALAKIKSAIDLNPLPPDDYLWTAGGALFFLNDYDGALSYLRRMKRQDPAFRLTAACLAMLGRRQEAATFVARALENQPGFRVNDWVATIPLRSRIHIAQYADALRQAGFY